MTDRQYQIKLNGVVLLTSDEEDHVFSSIATAIVNTLVVTKQKYTREWVKEEQGDNLRDVLKITTI